MRNLFRINFTCMVAQNACYSIDIENTDKLLGSVYFFAFGKGVPKNLLLESQQNQNYINLNAGDNLEIFGEVSGDIDVCKVSVKKMNSHAPAHIYVSGPVLKLDNGSNLPTNECTHEWKHYQGIFESYNYCVKCDKKDKQ